jgi:hypothetical protein
MSTLGTNFIPDPGIKAKEMGYVGKIQLRRLVSYNYSTWGYRRLPGL